MHPTVLAQVDHRSTGTGASLTHLIEALADWSLAHRDSIAASREVYDDEHPDNEVR